MQFFKTMISYYLRNFGEGAFSTSMGAYCRHCCPTTFSFVARTVDKKGSIRFYLYFRLQVANKSIGESVVLLIPALSSEHLIRCSESDWWGLIMGYWARANTLVSKIGALFYSPSMTCRAWILPKSEASVKARPARQPASFWPVVCYRSCSDACFCKFEPMEFEIYAKPWEPIYLFQG